MNFFFYIENGILYVLIRTATQHTFMFKKIEKISLLCLLTWRYHEYSLQLPLSRTYRHGSKGFRAIEVLLTGHLLHDVDVCRLSQVTGVEVGQWGTACAREIIRRRL